MSVEWGINMKKLLLIGIVLISLTASLVGCGKHEGKDVDEIEKKNLAVGVSVHDPSVVKDGDNYYIFGSHMEAAQSSDLKSWKSFASGVNAKNPLFTNLFDEEKAAFSFVGEYIDGGYAVWAPDVIYNKTMKKWVMYFSTSHDYRTSSICFATADDVKGPYTYVDTLISSGFTTMTVKKTNFADIMADEKKVSDYLFKSEYNNMKYPNCIDPTVFYDKDGKLWMVYGSWSGGIWLLEIDENTGYPIHPETNEETHTDKYFGQYLIGGLHNSCEGPYIIFDEKTQYYYLLVSYGGLTREGGYQIRCFRAENVTGPYYDATGGTFGYTSDHTECGVKMMGNYMLPSLKTAYMAPGHCSALIDDDGKMYLVYHQRFNSGSEYHEPRVHQMFTNEDGWLVTAPFATDGEGLKSEGYSDKDIEGKWYLLNHGLSINSVINDTAAVTLKKNEVIDTEKIGSYTIQEDSVYMSMTLEDVVYKGVVIDMTDEAGNPVRCFMAVGDNNKTIWAVKYI